MVQHFPQNKQAKQTDQDMESQMMHILWKRWFGGQSVETHPAAIPTAALRPGQVDVKCWQ